MPYIIIQDISSLPSGIRLMNSLRDHLTEIMDHERANLNSIHLYCMGSYWVSFERSAYQLRRVFPDSEIMPLYLFAYPFPTVMMSVTDHSPYLYVRKHTLRRDETDYRLLTVPGLPMMNYHVWHAGEVEDLPQLT